MDSPTGRHVFCSLRDHFGNNASISDHGQGNTLQEIFTICANCGLRSWRITLFGIALAALSGCSVDSNLTAIEAPVAAPGNGCGEDGYLTTELFGALQARVQWSADTLECEGMPRPGGDGARLRFAGNLDSRRIAFIIALPDLRRGAMSRDLPATVTLIEEGGGRFFSTADSSICFADITRLQPVALSDSTYLISGNLYCVAPLVQVNGDADVLIRDLEFRGLLDWNRS
jgi:hypothetical protein